MLLRLIILCEFLLKFYFGIVPFHLARNFYDDSSDWFIANHKYSDYLPSGYELLRTMLAQRGRRNNKRLLNEVGACRDGKGCILFRKGYTDS